MMTYLRVSTLRNATIAVYGTFLRVTLLNLPRPQEQLHRLYLLRDREQLLVRPLVGGVVLTRQQRRLILIEQPQPQPQPQSQPQPLVRHPVGLDVEIPQQSQLRLA